MQSHIKSLKLPQKAINDRLRPMEPSDVKGVHELLSAYLERV